MSTTAALLAELVTLRAAVKAHSDRIQEASWQRTLAMEFAGVPTKWGGAMYDLPKGEEWRYPSVAEASRLVEALEEAPGYFWACSRVRDLEGLVGESVPQLPLRTEDNYIPLFRGHIPEAHPTVRDFLAAA